MYLSYGLLADAVVQGSQGKKNLIGTFTTIYAYKFPCQHPSLSLAIRIEGNNGEIGSHHLELAFVDADYTEIGKPVESDFELENNQFPIEGIPLAFEAVMNIHGLPFPKPGSYEFVVKVDGRHIGSIPLYMVKVAQPSA